MADVEAVTDAQIGSATDPRCIVISDSRRVPCDICGHPMEPEHAHYKCPGCGYIMPCCGW